MRVRAARAARIRTGGAGRNAGRGATEKVAPPPHGKLQNVGACTMLPEETVAAIFTKLLLVYGKRFSDQYAGQDLLTVKRHWQHELSGMPAWAVSHGLEHLPADFPPNVLQFRQTCNQCPAPMRALIPPPRGVMSPRV